MNAFTSLSHIHLRQHINHASPFQLSADKRTPESFFNLTLEAETTNWPDLAEGMKRIGCS